MATASDADGNIEFNFDFRREHTDKVKLEGGAHYPKDYSCLRLTDTRNNSDGSVIPLDNNAGRVIYTEKMLPFSKQTIFETTIRFTLTPMPDASPADGLVFFMAPFRHSFPGNSYNGNFGVFGLSGKDPKVFAVEFDAFFNPLWDPNYGSTPLHLGIDIGSRESIKHDAIPDSLSYIGKEVTLNITYTGEVIRAKVSNESHPNGLEVTYQFDLSSFLPNDVEIGLAASTGQHVALHDVVAWEFTSTLNN